MELCRLLDFKDLGDERGKLVVVEGAQEKSAMTTFCMEM